MGLHRFLSICAVVVITASPAAVRAVDIPIPAKSHKIVQDRHNGYVADLAAITSRPADKTIPFPIPAPGGASDPTIHGASLRFCKINDGSSWSFVDLPAHNWRGLGFPAGVKGYKYKGDGTGVDPCTSVVIREKSIRAKCKGPGAFDAPSPYSLPVGSDGAGFELVVGPDRYCAESSPDTIALIKKNSGVKGVFKATRANAPAACKGLDPTPTPTPTPPYGSTSRAFVTKGATLLR